MSLPIGDALFDFTLALRLEHPADGDGDPREALERLPRNAGLPLNQVAAWPTPARAGLLALLEVWLHVDALAADLGLSLGYPPDLTERTRPGKLGAGVVAWLRAAGPALATMTDERDQLREACRRRAEPQAPGATVIPMVRRGRSR